MDEQPRDPTGIGGVSPVTRAQIVEVPSLAGDGSDAGKGIAVPEFWFASFAGHGRSGILANALTRGVTITPMLEEELEGRASGTATAVATTKVLSLK